MKTKNIVMAFLLVIALLFIPNVYAANDIEIKSVTMEDKSKDAVYDQNPNVDGLTISFEGISFMNKGDFILYRVKVTNNSNEDYQINNGTSFSKSEYFKYEFEFVGDNNVVPKNSTKDMFIRISYNKEVPATILEDDGSYRENNAMVINLTNKVDNPKTGSGIAILLVFAFIVAVASISVIIGTKTKLNKHLVMIVALALAIVPVTIYAAKMITINLNTDIGISKNYYFYVVDTMSTCGNDTIIEKQDDEAEERAFAQTVQNNVPKDCYNDHNRYKYVFEDGVVSFGEAFEQYNLPTNNINNIYLNGNPENPIKITDKFINGGIYYFIPSLPNPGTPVVVNPGGGHLK